MYLLDTNVISEFRKIRVRKADPNVAAWEERVDSYDQYVSVITLHEMELGILLLDRYDTAQASVLRKWLDDYVRPTFRGRILAVDEAVAIRATKLHVPNPRPYADAFLAATALVHGMTMVTRNVSDFAPMGVPILNPWNSTENE
jgi:predicted nucleic acid-binding protein